MKEGRKGVRGESQIGGRERKEARGISACQRMTRRQTRFAFSHCSVLSTSRSNITTDTMIPQTALYVGACLVGLSIALSFVKKCIIKVRHRFEGCPLFEARAAQALFHCYQRIFSAAILLLRQLLLLDFMIKLMLMLDAAL